jgi:ParB family chromosome partitioning protein
LSVDAVRPNPYQPRHAIDETALAELAESLRSAGLLQPIVVRPVSEASYELIAGERRWRAAQRIGWGEIPAVIREVDDRTLLTLALVENLQRDALSPVDEALGYQRLIEEFAFSQADVAEQVGRDRSTVANALRLLKLPKSVQEMLHAGTLTTGHARALLALKDHRAIEPLAREIVARQLSVRDVEARTRTTQVAGVPGARTRKPPSPEVRRVEDALRKRLRTDVRVATRGKDSGKLTVNFYSQDDLSRILELILGRPYNG